MNPVGLILNEFLCCIVNIHVLHKYEIDLIATDKCYCDVTLYFRGPKGWMQCLYGRAGDQKGSCDFHRQSLRTTSMTDACRGSLKTIR